MDKSLYDVLLRLKPAVPQSDRILLLDVDDTAIDNIGTWPWPRNLMADGLTTLRELGLGQIVFDIEFLNPSPPGVDRHYLDNGLKRTFEQTFGSVGSDVYDLIRALQSKDIPLKAADGYASDLVNNATTLGNDLYDKTKQVAQNNDHYLGQALAYFGPAYLTLNKQDTVLEFKTPEAAQDHQERLNLAAQRFSQPFQGGESARSLVYRDFFVPLPELASRARGAGLTNVEIDPDGKRRRIRVFEKVNDRWYAQLGLSPVIDLLSPTQIQVTDQYLTLLGAHLGSEAPHNVSIPLDEKGAMLIPWQKENFLGSFLHLSFYDIINLERQEDTVVSALLELAGRNSWSLLPGAFAAGSNPAQDLYDAYTAWEKLRTTALVSGTPGAVEASLAAKDHWMAAVDGFTKSPTRQAMAQATQAQLDMATGDQRDNWASEQKHLEVSWKNLDVTWKAYTGTRAFIGERVRGKLAFVGWTGTGTTDLAATPFDNKYALVGTHANVANAILQNQFVTETPTWWSLLLMVPLGFGLVFVLRRLPPLTQNLTGVGVSIVFFAAGLILFLVMGVYLPMSGPLLVMIITFVAYSLVRFLGTEKEKSFLKKAFSTYLSGEVIDEIVTDPSRLKLGGDQKWMTAMFTDVKGFSTISEKLTATELVHLLNEYLSGMSDIVLNEKGTIDKFEGDAIIAFFGAPLDLPDHAARACLAAIRMRQLEAAMNPGFLERKMSPVPLFTRIGINTGEMVVGNMGTERKMNYTIMGNAVNLSARLEGVNKQYGTWILATEFTATEAGDAFLFRKLDRVRVVGINTPVRLMNLLGLREEAGPEGEALVTGFHAALDAFEARQWDQASAAFQALAQRFPEDGPCQLYAKRCQAILAGSLQVADDGVFNLTEK